MASKPDLIRGVNNAFAAFTITVRLPAILDRILSDHPYPAPIKERVLSLKAEIPGGILSPIPQDSGKDHEAWARWMKPFEGMNWLQAPFLEAEIYFYRRILSAIDYFEAGPWKGVDPFRPQKMENLLEYQDSISALCKLRNGLADAAQETALPALLLGNLWGNRADLSFLPETRAALGTNLLLGTEDALVVNDLPKVIDFFATHQGKLHRIDFINDNSGTELVGDLVLAEYLLSANLAKEVRFQLKTQPFYVSDAMKADVWDTIEWMAHHQDVSIQEVGHRLGEFLGDRLVLDHHTFWTEPLNHVDWPADLREELAESDLLIFKGDANYRRLIEDRFWAYTTPFADLVPYLPTTMLSLRTLKCDVLAGLDAAGPYPFRSPDWLVSGKMGLIQMRGQTGSESPCATGT